MKLYKLCVALVAVLAIGAVGSASASAVEFHATAPGTSLYALAETSQIFKPEAYDAISCSASASNLTGTLPPVENSPTQELHPEIWPNCTKEQNPNIIWTVNTAGCEYKYFATGSVELRACTNGGMKFKTESYPSGFKPDCTMEIPNQTAVGGVTYENFTDQYGGQRYKIIVNSTFKVKNAGNVLVCAPNASTVKVTQKWAVYPNGGSSIWVS